MMRIDTLGRSALSLAAIVLVAVMLIAACSTEPNGTPGPAPTLTAPTLSSTSAPSATTATTTPIATAAASTITTLSLPTESVTTTTSSVPQGPVAPAITYVGATYDQSDLALIDIGKAGYWLPQFGSPVAVNVRPTDENAVDLLPDWIGPLNHFSILSAGEGCSDEALKRGCRPGFGFRTFSQDGPATSSGGHAGWSTLTTPDGKTGISGAIVDPHTDGNSNNTVNRIQLEEGVPATFYLHVIVDNTAGNHDPTATLRARANIGLLDLNDQVEPDVLLQPCDLLFNGEPDIYTFRFDGFAPEDYIKLRLSGTPGAGGASFGGFLLDETFDEASSTRSPTAEHGSNPLC